jgi:hypothetical protein
VVAVFVLQFAVPIPRAWAADDWCIVDPPVLVTVAGKPVLVNVLVGTSRSNLRYAHSAMAVGRVDGDTVTITLSGPPVPFTATAKIARLRTSVGDPTHVYAPGETVTLTLAGLKP